MAYSEEMDWMPGSDSTVRRFTDYPICMLPWDGSS